MGVMVLLVFFSNTFSPQIASKQEITTTLYNQMPFSLFVSCSTLPLFGCGLSGRGAVGACGDRTDSKLKVESSGWVGVFGGEGGRASGCD